MPVFRSDAAARRRLGTLLVRRRVELDPRWKNRALFARETGINLRLVQDIENGAMNRKRFDESTKALFEVNYRWAPGSFDAVLSGGDPVPSGDGHEPGPDLGPDIVQRLWGDIEHSPAHVRALWGLRNVPEAERADLIESYARTLPGMKANGGTQRRRA